MRITYSRSIVGRWALDSFVVNGDNWTAGVRSGPIAYYTLNGDGTFRITRGDSLMETGTWSQDTTVSLLAAGIPSRPAVAKRQPLRITGHIISIQSLPGHGAF